MRERMERFSVLPFSIGCVSQSSVAVIDTQTRKATMDSNLSPKGSYRAEEGESFAAAGKARPPFGFLSVPKPTIPAGLQRLIRSFKGLSQLFTLYREEDEEEMDIGFPTDVKHVAHVGWDAAAATGGAPTMTGWDRGPELLALPSISLRQFELAMAARGDAPVAYKSAF